MRSTRNKSDIAYKRQIVGVRVNSIVQSIKWLRKLDTTTYISTPDPNLLVGDTANFITGTGLWNTQGPAAVYGHGELATDPTGTVPWGSNVVHLWTTGATFGYPVSDWASNSDEEDTSYTIPGGPDQAEFVIGVDIFLPSDSDLPVDAIRFNLSEDDENGDYISGSNQADETEIVPDTWQTYRVRGLTSALAVRVAARVQGASNGSAGPLYFANCFIRQDGGDTFVPAISTPGALDVNPLEVPVDYREFDELRIGEGFTGYFPGVARVIQTTLDPIAMMIPDDIGLGDGPVPDQTTWIGRDGREWTVHGDGLVLYEPEA